MSKLPKTQINELITLVTEVPTHTELVKAFDLAQLESVAGELTKQRAKLIEIKSSESNGFLIEKYNLDLSGIKQQISKINKAIAELKIKPKKTKNYKTINVTSDTILSADDQYIIKCIKDCRTIPDIYENFDEAAILIARNHFQTLRQLTVDEMQSNTDQSLQHSYNNSLRMLKNDISRCNKAIAHLNQIATKQKRETDDPKLDGEVLHKSYKFLKAFFDLAQEEVDSKTLKKLINQAEIDVTEPHEN